MRKQMMAVSIVVMMLAGTTLAYAGNFFVTRHGKRFHQSNCPLLKDKRVKKISENSAEEKGIDPCSICLRTKALRAEEPKKAKRIKEVKSKKQIKAQKKAEKEKNEKTIK